MIIQKQESLVIGLAIILILGISYILYIAGMRELSMFFCFSFVIFSIWWIYSFIINALLLKKIFSEVFEIWSILNGINFGLLYILIVFIWNNNDLHQVFSDSKNQIFLAVTFIFISWVIETIGLRVITKKTLWTIFIFIVSSFILRYGLPILISYFLYD